MSTQQPLKAGISYNADEITSIYTQIEDKGIIVLFNYIEDETSTLEASITDNYVETNHSVQDHIAIKPKIYRLRGCIGEVVYKSSNEFTKAISEKINSNPILKKTIDTMSPIAAVSPVISNYTQAAINIVNQIESSYNRYKQLIENNFLQGRQRQLTNKMQQATVADLNRILELRLPVNLKGLKFETVLTAGDDYARKYYIQSVSAHQGSNDFISDIEVTIKEFRIATTKIVDVDSKNVLQVMNSTETNQGIATAQESPVNLSEPTVMDTIANKVGNITKPIAKNAAEGKTASGKLCQWFFNAQLKDMVGVFSWLTGIK